MIEIEPTNKRETGAILWRGRYLILASIIAMVVLAAAYAFTTAKTYQATGILQVNLTTATPGSSDTASANQALAQNYATVLVSRGFLSQLRPQVEGGKLSLDSLQSQLSASAPAQGSLIELQATGSSPTQAQTIAQEVMGGFLASLQTAASSHTAQLESQLQQQIAALSAQISALAPKAGSPSVVQQINLLKSSRQALINQNATLVANGLAQGTSATESASPVASSTPVSPKRSLDLIGGLLLGVLLGVALAWLRQRVRPAIHSAEEVASVVNLPVIASIPLTPSLEPGEPKRAEAYRVLQANLMLSMRAEEMRLVTFLGCHPQVGTTSIVEGLAKVAGWGERRVLVIDADIRTATLSAKFGFPGDPGLVELLQGTADLDSTLVELNHDLWLLPTRTRPSRVNPAALLGGSRALALTAVLKERFDAVLIDSPPLPGLADGLILASHSDTVLLVARSGLTKPSDLTAAAKSVQQIAAAIAGVVVLEELPVERHYRAAEAGSGTARPQPWLAGR